MNLRLEEGCVLEFVIRKCGGRSRQDIWRSRRRILGRYWYNTIYGGAPNRL